MVSNRSRDENIFAKQRSLKICEEVGFDPVGSKLEASIITGLQNPDVIDVGTNLPPPGYENSLVASLMAKASAESLLVNPQTVHAQAGSDSFVEGWHKLVSKLFPATGFAFALVIGLAIAQFFVQRPDSSKIAKSDLWAKAVEKANHEDVSRWMASVSDLGSGIMGTNSDLEILSSELSEEQMQLLIEKNGGS